MIITRCIIIYALLTLMGCKRSQESQGTGRADGMDDIGAPERLGDFHTPGALLLTQYKTLEEFKKIVDIQYYSKPIGYARGFHGKAMVQLNHTSNGYYILSVLKTGVSEDDFLRARDGSLWDKAWVGLLSPFAVFHKDDLVRAEILGRRRNQLFGEGDIAFYDLAESMVINIRVEDTLQMSTDDLGEKGYLNTFNHIIAQAFMTTLFSESVADYVADVHERKTMPALITGQFTEKQLNDWKDGAVDNYLDMVNNEWGQEVGKYLKRKYRITRHTYWTPDLLVDYLNDLQAYHSGVFDIGFNPFRISMETIKRFTNKINAVNSDLETLIKFY